MLTEYQKRWLRRTRLLNRMVWGCIVSIGLAMLLTHVGLPLKVFQVIAFISMPILAGFILFVFLASCPKCGKDFYSIGFFGRSNAFTSKCLNCGLTWKGLKQPDRSSCILTLLLLSVSLMGHTNTAIADNKPVLVLVKYGVWNTYTGPDFILYEDGLVIFQRSKSYPPKFFSVRLGAEDEYKIFSLMNAEFMELNDYYRLTRAFDLTTNTIIVWKPMPKQVSVYGIGFKDVPGPPLAFERLLHFLDNFDRYDAVEWFPDYFNLGVYELDFKEWISHPILWPAHWPSLEDNTLVNKSQYGSYHLRVPHSDLDILRSMCPEYGREHPVQMGRKQFRVQYAPRVPHENFIFDQISSLKPRDR